MPLNTRQETQITQQVNCWLDKIPVHARRDFKHVDHALKSILESGQVPKDVDDSNLIPLQHIASMIEQPKSIPKSDHADYRSLVRSCIKKRIKRFGALSDQQKDAYILRQAQDQQMQAASAQHIAFSDEDPEIITAASQGNVEILAHLLDDERVDVNMADDYGITALLSAALENQVKAVEILLAHGANMEQPGPDGMTPLLGAARKGHVDIVELLLQHGANRKAVDCKGRTAYDLATEHGHHAIAQKIQPQRH